MTGLSARSSRPRVSVAFTTYNHEPYIRESLESVLTQRVDFPYEIVVGDDCSTDNNRTIIREYASRYPNVFRLHFPNANQGHRGNRIFVQMLAMARGEYVAMLDGDDYWVSTEKLQKQVDFMDAHPEHACSFHNVIIKDERSGDQSKVSTRFGDDMKSVYTVKDLLSKPLVPTCASMFRRDVIDHFPPWLETAHIADWVIHVVCAQQGTIGYFDDVMSVYRWHPGGVWTPLVRAEKYVMLSEGVREINEATAFRFSRRLSPRIARHRLRAAKHYYISGQRLRAFSQYVRYLSARYGPPASVSWLEWLGEALGERLGWGGASARRASKRRHRLLGN